MKLDTMLRNEMLHIAGQTYVHVEIGDYSLSYPFARISVAVSFHLLCFATSSQAFSSSFSLFVASAPLSIFFTLCTVILKNI